LGSGRGQKISNSQKKRKLFAGEQFLASHNGMYLGSYPL
jgi:hypothetical protein